MSWDFLMPAQNRPSTVEAIGRFGALRTLTDSAGMKIEASRVRPESIAVGQDATYRSPEYELPRYAIDGTKID